MKSNRNVEVRVKKKLSGGVKILLAFAIMAVVIFPVFWMINISFFKQSQLFSDTPLIAFLNGYNLEGYKEVLSDTRVYEWLGNSIFVSLIAVGFSVVFSVLAAYGLSRFKSKLNNVMTVVIICTQMIAPALILAPLYKMFARVGLANNHLGLIMVDTALVLSFSIWIMKGFIDNIPKELDEAAQIDGCNRFATLVRVILPVAKPVFITVMVINFFDIFNEYMFAMTFIQKQSLWLSTVGLSINMSRVGMDWSTLLPQTVITCLIPVIFYFIFQRYIVKGLSAGAVKL